MVQSPDRSGAPPVTQKEVVGSLTKDSGKIKGAMPQAELDQIHDIQKARGDEGSLGGFTALEKARVAAETGDKQWEGARGEDVEKLFIGPEKTKIAALVEQANDTVRALEIIGLDPLQQDARLAEMQAAGLIDAKYASADQLIEAVCAQMAANRSFDVCFPMLDAQGMSADEKAAWFREALPKMPSVRAAISESMAKWQESIYKFTDVPQTERLALDTQKQEKEQKAADAKASLEKFIKDGLKIDLTTVDPADQASLELAMTKGDTNAVRQILLRADKFSPQEISNINSYEEKLAELAKNRNILKNPESTTDKVFVQAEIDRLVVETGATNVPAKYARYQEVRDYVEADVFKMNLTEYSSQTKEANDLAIKISKLPTNQNEIKLQVQRKREERAVLDGLKVDAFISKAIVAGYDEAETAYSRSKQSGDKQRLQAAEQASRMDEAVMYTNKLKRWIEAEGNGNPEIVHLDNIRTDLNIVRKYGEVGIKFIIARDAGLFDKTLKFKVNGNSKTGDNMQTMVEDGTLSANQALAYLDTSRNDRLNSLVTKKDADGKIVDNDVIADYRETLLMDYNQALRYVRQGRLGRFISYGRGSKQLKMDGTIEGFELKKSEFSGLLKKLGVDNVDDAFVNDERVRNYMKKLEGKGIVSGDSWKILQYVLMMMAFFALPGLGVGAIAGGLGGIGAGVGAAGAGIGAGVGLGSRGRVQ